MGAQLSTDLRHITVGTGRKHAGGGSISAGEGKLLAEPDYFALKAGNPGDSRSSIAAGSIVLAVSRPRCGHGGWI